MNNFSIFNKYIKHQLTARNFKGFGIHSPYIFHLVTEIIHDYTPFYCFNNIEKERQKLLKNRSSKNYTKPNSNKVDKRNLSSLPDIKHILKQKKQDQLLFRLVNYFQSEKILELGASFGITTSYLASVSSKSTITSIHDSCESIDLSHLVFANLNIKNIHTIKGNFNDKLKNILPELKCIDFVFFNRSCTNKSALDSFNMCLPYINNNSVFVITDIHNTDDSEATWNKIKDNELVTTTLDLFYLGIIFFKKEFSKQHFKIKFNL